MLGITVSRLVKELKRWKESTLHVLTCLLQVFLDLLFERDFRPGHILSIVAEGLHERHDAFFRVFLDHELWHFHSFRQQHFDCASDDHIKSISFISLFNDICFIVDLYGIQIFHHAIEQLRLVTFIQLTEKLKSLEEFAQPLGVCLCPLFWWPRQYFTH